MALEFTGSMRYLVRTEYVAQTVGSEVKTPVVTRTLQQQWGQKNNWAWYNLQWLDVPVVVVEEAY
jgi:hypothetical protein